MTSTESIRIISTHRGSATDTIVVEVDGERLGGLTDRALADAVGFSESHFGFTVDRTSIDANRATVRLHKD